MDTEPAERTKARFARLFGDYKLAEKLSALAGWSRPTVFRYMENGFPADAILIADLLERLDEKDWPPSAKAAKTKYS